MLLYHDVPPWQQARLAAQLRWLARSWHFVSPDEVLAMVAGAVPVRGRNLLLTFDDGFASNRIVAEQVLAPMGIRALFFVISDFVMIEEREEARAFIARNIQPGVRREDVPEHLLNMGWRDLEALLEQGHSVGAHTRLHSRLSMLPTGALSDEIVDSADAISRRLGVSMRHFAYPYGDWESCGPRAFALARSRFECIYSGIRGANASTVRTGVFCRDALTSGDSLPVVGTFVEGGADRMYARSRGDMMRWSVKAVARVAP